MKNIFFLTLFLFVSACFPVHGKIIRTEESGKTLTVYLEYATGEAQDEFYIALDDAQTLPRVSVTVADSMETGAGEEYGLNEFKKEFRYAGIQKNIYLAYFSFNPYKLDPLKGKAYLAKKAVISFSFSSGLKNEEASLHLPFFAHVINQKRLRELATGFAKKKSAVQAAADDWFDPDKTYLKLSTSTEEIYSVPASAVISASDYFAGKESRHLDLIFKGESYPFHIIDPDGTFDEGDTLIFKGRRAEGDTTWFDNYELYSRFFLTFDESATPERLNTYPGLPVLAADRIDIFSHYEKDSVYAWGSVIDLTATASGEGWFWDYIMKTDGDAVIAREFFLDPGNPGSAVNIKVGLSNWLFEELSSHLTVVTNDITLLVNGKPYDNEIIYGRYGGMMQAQVPAEDLIKGMNQVALLSKHHFFIADTITGTIGLDYIEAHYQSRKATYDSSSFYNIPAAGTAQGVTLYGLPAERCLAVDTENKMIYDIYGSRELRISLSAFSNGTDKISAKIDERIFRAGKNLIIWLDENGLVTGVQSDITAGALSGAIGSGSGAYAAVSFSGAEVTAALRETMSEYGISLPDNFGNNEFYCALLDISAKSRIAGGLFENNGFTHIIPGPGNSFSAEIAVPPAGMANLKISPAGGAGIPVIETVNHDDLDENPGGADVLVLYHKKFKPVAERYKELREKGKKHKVAVIDIDDVYKEFGFGKKNPHVIKDFIRFTQSTWAAKPDYFLLLGDTKHDSRHISDKTVGEDYIPTYGLPASDNWYALLNEEEDYLPDVVLSRLPINSLEDGDIYLDKLEEYENNPQAEWHKKFFFISGGIKEEELPVFYGRRFQFTRELAGPSSILCADTVSIGKTDILASTQAQASQIRSVINEGTAWVNFLGHASAELFDNDGWQVGTLNNKGKYGLFTSISCNTGAFAENTILECRNESYLFERDKGFLGVIGGTTTGEVSSEAKVVSFMLKGMNNNETRIRTLGDAFLYGKSFLAPSGHEYRAIYSYNCLGDPLYEIRIDTSVNIGIEDVRYRALNKGYDELINEDDEKTELSADIYNYGTRNNLPVRVSLKHYYLNEMIAESDISFSEVCNSQPYSFLIGTGQKPGVHKIVLEAFTDDPEQDISNNKKEIDIEVFRTQLLPLEPQPYRVFNKGEFRFLDPNGKVDNEYEFRISAADGIVIRESAPGEIDIRENYLQWNAGSPGTKGVFTVAGRYFDVEKNSYSAWLEVPFSVDTSIEAPLYMQNRFSDLNDSEFLLTEAQKENDGTDILTTFRERIFFSVHSSHGYRYYKDGEIVNSDSVRYARIETKAQEDDPGGHVYVNDPFARGFNIVRIPMDSNMTGIYKRFDTWGKEEPVPDQFAVSSDLVNYLKDSVRSDEYVMIATCEGAWRALLETDITSPGYIDSLRAVLKTAFGATLIDQAGDGSSYALVGVKGQAGFLREAVLPYDTVVIEGHFDFIRRSASFSEILPPSNDWKNRIITETADLDMENSVKLIASDLDGNIVAEQQLTEGTNITELDKTPENTQSIRLTYLFGSSSLSRQAKVRQYKVENDPLPDFAIIRSQSVLSSGSVERGFDVKANMAFEQTTTYFTGETDYGFVLENTSAPVEYMDYGPINGAVTGQKQVSTTYLDPQNTVRYRINPTSEVTELYRFNNEITRTLDISEDKIKPSFKAYFDNVEVRDGDHVTEYPFIRIELYDNSPLPVTDHENIFVRINGKVRFDGLNTKDYTFTSNGTQTDLKAFSEFRLDTTLDYGSNIMGIYVKDATGNVSDTLTYTVFVSLNAEFSEVNVYPNPTEGETHIAFRFTGPRVKEKARLLIYDSFGRIVTERITDIQLGMNDLHFDLLKANGSSVSSGIYFYELRLESDIFAEPVQGLIGLTR